MRMHTLTLWFLNLLVFLSTGVLGLQLDRRAPSIADIPPCGIRCLFFNFHTSDCNLADVQCLCQNVDLLRASSACMLANCTMADSLAYAKVGADICHLPDDSRASELFRYTVSLYAIAVAFVALRVLSKLLSQRFAPDDWIIVAALLLSTVPVGCVLTMISKGFGNHLWNLNKGQLRENLQLFYVAGSTYIVTLGLIKISLVLFYLQIFQHGNFRITSYIVLSYIVASTLAIFLASIFACIPVHSVWDRDVNGKCINRQALAFANSGSAIVQDVILLIMPLMCIRKLHMKRYRKFAVGLMFAIGTFGCITTILRLQSLATFEPSLDPTWDYVSVVIWTELELGCGFICVSLPSIRNLITMALPKRVKGFFSSVTFRSRSHNSSSVDGDALPLPTTSKSRMQEERDLRDSIVSWSPTPVASPDSKTPASSNLPGYSIGSRIAGTHPISTLMTHHLFTQMPPQSPVEMSAQQREWDSYLEDQRPQLGHTDSKDFASKSPHAEMGKALLPSSTGHEQCGTTVPQIGCLPEGSYSQEFEGVESSEMERDGVRLIDKEDEGVGKGEWDLV